MANDSFTPPADQPALVPEIQNTYADAVGVVHSEPACAEHAHQYVNLKDFV